MNKLYSFLLVLLTIAFAICVHISPHKIAPNCTTFCSSIDCEPVKTCDGGFILENGSYCGCCNACVKYLDNNQACNKILTGPLALVAQSRCKKGSECINGKCIFVADTASGCQRQKNIREKRKGTLLYNENIWIPQCDLHGNYAAKQKKMRKSICVDESGKKIFGRADDTMEDACACSRYMQKKEKIGQDAYDTEPREHCSPSGSFALLQCIGNLCYCANDNTGEVKSRVVTRNCLEKLPCFDKSSQTKNYLTNCERELQRTRKLIHDFKKKGIRVIGVDRIKCDPDGSYSPVQCTLTNCICTDKDGAGIKSHHPDIEEGKNMTCDCAREEIYQHNTMFRCTASGDYHPITCVDNHCLCVDDDGDIISKTLSKDHDNETCEELRHNLTINPDDNNDGDDNDNINDNHTNDYDN